MIRQDPGEGHLDGELDPLAHGHLQVELPGDGGGGGGRGGGGGGGGTGGPSGRQPGAIF